MGTDRFERRAVISGIGQSALGRQIERSGFQLTLDAILAAIAVAQLITGLDATIVNIALPSAHRSLALDDKARGRLSPPGGRFHVRCERICKC